MHNVNHIIRDMDGLRHHLWLIAVHEPERLEGRETEIEGIRELLGKVIERVKRHSEKDVA